ncbi:MAG: hypothetical protein KAT35_01470, partial [Candidatus Aenigmarchaeota archaeon]|nr:hypothetical protein [Candidatus Aenigmarchaeota archaeon]
MGWSDYIGQTDWAKEATMFGTLEGRWVGEAWQSMAILAVIISFFIVSIGWMLATAFNHAGL